MAKNGLDYELIDFGGGRKLERFGKIILDRPEVLAKGKRKLPDSVWTSKAQARYDNQGRKVGKWNIINLLPDEWECIYKSKKCRIEAELKAGRFKHVGIFPEQEKHWRFIEKHIRPEQKMLNLFGYTGMASLVGAKCGADVFHNDSSKSIIRQAARNAEKSRIDSIHWVCEDALKFALREKKRNHRYNLIIMDPPVFGRGKNGERWKLEELLPKLVKTVSALLHRGGILILNTYSPKVGLENMKAEMALNHLNCIDSGWLSVQTRDGRSLELSKFTVAKNGNGA